LAAMLVGNPCRSVNGGLQSLQICGNCIMPQLAFYTNSLVQHFPSHAEGFNQNINSQGFGSANLTRRAVEIFQHYMAVALLFGVQASELRSKLVAGHYDGRRTLSPASLPLYQAIYEVIGAAPRADKPLVWNDYEQELDQYLARLVADLQGGAGQGGKLAAAVSATRTALV